MFQFNKKSVKKSQGAFLVVMLTFLFVCFFYGKVILSPNSYLFNPSGDGMKNYYTYAYYIQNNNDNIEFEGMNYPYGESFMYTDCHPVQAFVLKVLNQYFPSISNYSIGYMNLAMLLSIVLTSLVLYLVFKQLKINFLLSILGAFSITVLSPQIFRLIGGHYALSYSFFIPLIIYFLLKFEKRISNKNLVIFSLVILIAFFTHAYIGMILFVLIFTYSGVGILSNLISKSGKEVYYKNLKISIASFTPFILFYSFIKGTDSHIGRTTNPWGIFENHAELSSVFLPVSGPLNTIKDLLFSDLDQKWEGWAYIGIVAILGLVIYLLSFVIKQSFFQKINHNQFIKTLFFASLLILLFATLLPFRKIMYEIVDSIGMIKQFRAIGRFAWVFFFIVNIVAVYVNNEFYNYLKNKNKKLFAYCLILLLSVITIIEGVEYHSTVSSEITVSKNLFDINQTETSFKEDCDRINQENYQAIIGLPFFYIGSENFGKTSTQEIYKLSFLFSYHLNLPMVNSYLTRTSINESKNIMQLLSNSNYDKLILKDLKNSKPFLVICHHNNLSKADLEFIKKAKLITKQDNYSLYEIKPNEIYKKEFNKQIEVFLAKKNTLFQKNNFLVSDTILFFKYNDFNDTLKYTSINGNGGYVGLQNGYNSLFSINGNELDVNKKYIARFWMLNNGDKNGQDYLNGMIFFNKKTKEKEEWIFPLTDARNGHEISGNWSMVEVELEHPEKGFDYELIIKGPDRSKQSYYIDDFLFYDSELEIYNEESISDSMLLFKNNHRFKIPNSIITHSTLSF